MHPLIALLDFPSLGVIDCCWYITTKLQTKVIYQSVPKRMNKPSVYSIPKLVEIGHSYLLLAYWWPSIAPKVWVFVCIKKKFHQIFSNMIPYKPCIENSGMVHVTNQHVLLLHIIRVWEGSWRLQDRYSMINSKNKSENSPFHYSTIPVVQSNVYTITWQT